MLALRFFDVISDSLRRDAPDTPREITFTPKFLTPQKLRKQFRVILPHHSRRETLQKLNDLTRSMIFAICYKKVNVVGTKLETNQFDIDFSKFLDEVSSGQL